MGIKGYLRHFVKKKKKDYLRQQQSIPIDFFLLKTNLIDSPYDYYISNQ